MMIVLTTIVCLFCHQTAGQLILPWLQPNKDVPKISEGPTSQKVSAGSTVTLRCGVDRANLAKRVIWTYLDHGLVLTVNRTLLTMENRFSISGKTAVPGTSHYNLQIKNITIDDAGTYSCQVLSGSRNRLIQTAVLTVNGSSTSSLPGVSIQGSMVFERRECCKRMNVSQQCQKLCSGQSQWSAYDIVSSVQCLNYLGNFVYCASDQRNHVPCCIRRFVAADCLDFCAPPTGPNLTGFGFGQVASLSLRCFPQLSSITQCMEEGQHTIPDPPRSLSLTPLSPHSVIARWLPPSTTGFYSESQIKYRVFVAMLEPDDEEFSDKDFQITPGLTDKTEMEITALKPGKRYAVYVTAVSGHGTSAPSYIADMFTPPSVEIHQSEVASIEQCCLKSKVSSECADMFCSPKMMPESIRNITSGNAVFSCADSIQPAFKCLSGRFDHRQCCEMRRVPSNCISFCSQNAPRFEVEHASCLRYLGLMNACFVEGKKLFPGVPTNFSAENITASSAAFTWSLPTQNANTVVRYKLFIRPLSLARKGDDDIPHWEAIPTQNTRLVISGLEPDLPYTVTIWAESASGPGMRSVIDFSTLPISATRNVSNPFEPDMNSCCKMLGVKTECMRFCSIDAFANISSFAPDEQILFYSCLNADFHKVLACAADGRNHTACCDRQGVPSACLKVCSVSPSYRDIGREQAMCVSFSQTIIQCLKEGWSAIPKPPRSLDDYNVTKDSVVLTWRSPPSDSPLFTSFLISAWTGRGLSKTYTQYSMPVSPDQLKSSFFERKITGLKSGVRYSFRVFAVNDDGKSLASNLVAVLTKPDTFVGSTTSLVPFSAWTQNMSSCCANLKLSESCSTACRDVRALSATHCPRELPQLLGCWSIADKTPEGDKMNSDCCVNNDVPSECLTLCTSTAMKLNPIPRECIASLPLVISCYQRKFASVPSPPRRFTMVSTSALSAVLRWLPPSRNTASLSSYTLFYYPEPKSNELKSIENITALVPSSYTNPVDTNNESDGSVIDPGMMTFTLGDLKPSTLYRAWLVAVSNTSAVSLPSSEITFETSRELMYVTMLLSPGEYVPRGRKFTMICSPQFAYSNVTWWYSPPGPDSDSFSIKSALNKPSTTTPSPKSKKRNQLINNNERSTNFTFEAIPANASGEYTCRVRSNYTKKYYESTRFVKVMTDPKAETPFRKTTLPLKYYSTIPINCTFTGYPISFRWYQGATPFRSFPRTIFYGNKSISIIRVLAHRLESTSFTCNASNTFGSVSCEVAVDFIGPTVPTIVSTGIPWLPSNMPKEDEPSVQANIKTLDAMLDSVCCDKALRYDVSCKCPHQTAIASASMLIPKRCFKEIAHCALEESIPTAPRSLDADIGPYTVNASWIPPIEASYLGRFKISFVSDLDPRSPLFEYAEVADDISETFWTSRSDRTEISRFTYTRGDLIPDISYTMTVSSLNYYNFSRPSKSSESLEISVRKPTVNELYPVVAVSVSRHSDFYAIVQWSVEIPDDATRLLVEPRNSLAEIWYRQANNKQLENEKPNDFHQLRASLQTGQAAISLNASTDYYVFVMANVIYRGEPMKVSSSPMLLSSFSEFSPFFGLGGGISHEEYQSVKTIAIVFGIILLALLLVAIAVGVVYFIKSRRRHHDQMRHVRLSRTVSFESRAANRQESINVDPGETNYASMSNTIDAPTVKIQSPLESSNQTQFEMSTTSNEF